MKRTPLKRSSIPIPRGDPPKRRTPVRRKRTKPRRGPIRMPLYRRWLREECKCVVCCRATSTLFTVDPAHTQNNGMRSKGPDSSCAPLCRVHHREYDAGREAFEVKYRIDMKREAAVHFSLWSALSC